MKEIIAALILFSVSSSVLFSMQRPVYKVIGKQVDSDDELDQFNQKFIDAIKAHNLTTISNLIGIFKEDSSQALDDFLEERTIQIAKEERLKAKKSREHNPESAAEYDRAKQIHKKLVTFSGRPRGHYFSSDSEYDPTYKPEEDVCPIPKLWAHTDADGKIFYSSPNDVFRINRVDWHEKKQ